MQIANSAHLKISKNGIEHVWEILYFVQIYVIAVQLNCNMSTKLYMYNT